MEYAFIIIANTTSFYSQCLNVFNENHLIHSSNNSYFYKIFVLIIIHYARGVYITYREVLFAHGQGFQETGKELTLLATTHPGN